VDGRKTKLTGSLQFRLSASLSVLIATLAIGAGVVSYRAAFDEAIQWQDGNLRQMSAMTDGRSAGIDLPATIVDTVPDPDLQVVVEVLGPSGVSAPGSPLKIASPLRDGLQTVYANGEAWRLYARPLVTGNRLVVAQRSAERDQVAGGSAFRAVLALVAILPVLVVLVSVVVRRTLRPMKVLSMDLDQRSERELGALHDDPVPNELRPFTASINQLLSRLDAALNAQRRFVANAAHELRSPLTALTLQAEQLATRLTTLEEKEFMGRLQSGMQRMRSLLDQLLVLARAEADAVERGSKTTSVADALRRAIEQHMPLAEQRGIDLGLEGALLDSRIAASAIDVDTMLRNLLDNAIRYTPARGRVDISVHRTADRIVIVVADNGPGIPDADMQRVFDPFYRVLGTQSEGSGLGLAIVKVIADRVGGTVSIRNDSDSGGLCVTMSLPREDIDGRQAAPMLVLPQPSATSQRQMAPGTESAT
jgi:Signal transduction histidine kinase